MGKINYILFSLTFIFLICFVSADKIVNPTSQGTLDINTWALDYVKQNSQHIFAWDVADENGYLLYNNQTNCSFFLLESGTTNQITSGVANRTPDQYGWYKIIPANTLSNLNQYNYQIDCYMLENTSISGNLLDHFDVTPSGNALTIETSVIMLGSVLLLILISLVFFYIGNTSVSNVGKLTFITFSVVFMLMAVLSLVVISQQTLFGFENIMSGVETFWFVVKIGMTIGILAFFIIIFLMMLKYWKIKRGLID